MDPTTDSPLLVWRCCCSKALLAYLAPVMLYLALPCFVYFALPLPHFVLPCPTLLALHCLPYPWPCLSCHVTIKGALIGVVPFSNKLVKHEKVVPVNRSNVCATTLKHQTFALPFFPSYLLPFPPTHPLFFFLSSICHWSLLHDPPLDYLFPFFDSHRTHLHLPHPLQKLHWDSLGVVSKP